MEAEGQISKYCCRTRGGKLGDLLARAGRYDEGLSLGITQMEIYKARMILKEVYKRSLTNRQIADLLNYDTKMSLRLAAAYMRYLMDNIQITVPNTGYTRHINDWEAVIGYCGCSGVTRNSKGEFVWGQFVDYLEGRNPGTANLNKRWDYVYGWVRDAAYEYWRCVNTNCYYHH